MKGGIILDIESLQELSCELIAGAGEASECFFRALEAAKKGNFDVSEKLMCKGEDVLVKTHQKQTGLLQAEMNGSGLPFSLLLVHAQDHLMQVMLFKRIINELIEIYKKDQLIKVKSL